MMLIIHLTTLFAVLTAATANPLDEWIERTLVADEGVGIDGHSGGTSAKTLNECQEWCDATVGCHSIAWRTQGDCWLKEKCLTEDEPAAEISNGFSSFYKENCNVPGCARPISGCNQGHDVYWTGDCDGDGSNDHVCSTTINDNIWVVLSSDGCGNWKTASEGDCPAAFKGGNGEGPNGPECNNDQFKCDNGVCIPGVWKCDYMDDCGDNSDEQNCEDSNDGFKCNDGQLIPVYWKCDAYVDCKDGSDEQNCPCKDLDDGLWCKDLKGHGHCDELNSEHGLVNPCKETCGQCASQMNECLKACETLACAPDLDLQKGCNQMYSCSHACKMRELGLDESECKENCIRTGQSGCFPSINGYGFALCGPCTREGCPTWPTIDECEIGCSNYVAE